MDCELIPPCRSWSTTDESSYEQYREKKAETDAKYKAKKARQEHEDGEWHGIEEKDGDSSDDEVIADDAESSDDDEDEDEDGDGGEKKDKLMTTLDDGHVKGKNGLSKKAAMFFDQDIFADIDHNAGEESEEEDSSRDEDTEMGEVDGQVASDEEMVGGEDVEEVEGSEDGFETEEEAEDEWEDDGIEIVRGSKDEHWDSNELPVRNGKLGMSHPISRVRVKLTNHRYQHHHCRSHESCAPHCLWQESQN